MEQARFLLALFNSLNRNLRRNRQNQDERASLETKFHGAIFLEISGRNRVADARHSALPENAAFPFKAARDDFSASELPRCARHGNWTSRVKVFHEKFPPLRVQKYLLAAKPCVWRKFSAEKVEDSEEMVDYFRPRLRRAL